MALMPFELWAQLEPAALPDIEHSEAVLRVVDPSGTSTSYTPEALENLPTYRLVTTTPWRSEPAAFEGVRLTDLLQSHGLDRVDAIRIIAENDFVSVLEREVWLTDAFLIATRVDGRPHSRRARGPFQLVVDAEAYDGSKLLKERHLVWSAAVIEVSD